jgi:hypothetical protein
LRFPYTMFTLQTSFKPLLLKGRGVNPLVEMTLNSKEDISEDFWLGWSRKWLILLTRSSLLAVSTKIRIITHNYAQYEPNYA